MSLFKNFSVLAVLSMAVSLVNAAPVQEQSLNPRQAAPYAQGTCSTNVWWDHYENAPESATPFWMIATIRDQAGTVIGMTGDGTQYSFNPACQGQWGSTPNFPGWAQYGASHPLYLASHLENSMEMIPIQNGADMYIQFYLGAQAWTSTNVNNAPTASCTIVQDWFDNGNGGLRQRLACSFACTYSNGPESDNGYCYPTSASP